MHFMQIELVLQTKNRSKPTKKKKKKVFCSPKINKTILLITCVKYRREIASHIFNIVIRYIYKYYKINILNVKK